jgi:copper(I)-binding protein
MMWRLALLLALAPLAAQAAAATAAQSVTAAQPWVRFLLPSIPAAGYMVLHNNSGGPTTITGANSPACSMLMLHQSQDNSGMASMMAVPSITIAAQGQLTLAPGGYHLMCMQPHMQIGEKIPLRITFADGSALTINAPVYGAQTSP